MMRRLLATWHARNLEFARDRGTLLFTLVLPIALVVGMGFVFGGPERPLFKVGVLAPKIAAVNDPFLHERYVEFVPITDQADADPMAEKALRATLLSPQAAEFALGPLEGLAEIFAKARLFLSPRRLPGDDQAMNDSRESWSPSTLH